MTLLALLFVGGAWVLQQMPFLPSFYWLLPCIIPAGFAFYGSRHGHVYLVIQHASLIVLAFATGLFWAAISAQIRLSDALPPEWEGQDIQLVGVVASMPEPQERGERFEFDVEQIITKGAVVPRHISLAQYGQDFSAKFQPQQTVATTFHAGERWQLTVRLKRPYGTANPHGFDFEAWALERNIRATGYIRKDVQNRRIEAFVVRPGYLVEAAREKIRQRMATVLAGKQYASVLQALAIGDDSAIVQDDWQVFLRTGTNHLMSISGLHITMLAGLMFGLVYALWRRSETLTLWLPARKAATLAGLIVATLYALIAGFSVPSQRTLYMLAVFALALWSGRQIAMSRVLACALLIVVILDPWAVLAPGFWLSFGAVAVIAYAVGGRIGRPHWLREAVHTQWAVSLGLVPLLLVLFQQVSVVSPLANALAIPLISLVIVPLTLLGALLPLDWPLQLAHMVMTICMQFLQWLASMPLSTWQQQAPPGWTLPVAMLGVLWLLLPKGFPMRWLGLVAFMPMFLLEPPRPEPGAMKVTVLDVGQGLAVVVQTATHTLLYDAGPRYSSQSDSGSRIVVPYLRGEGIPQLDGFILSHDDIDHTGGMSSILAQMPIKWLASSLPENTYNFGTARHMPCYTGQSWLWDGVRFDMLSPDFASYQDADIKDNNRSCVLRVTSRYGNLLLTGDIERVIEEKLLATMPEQLAANVLVAPHHGSKTSSSPDFIDAVKPGITIFTVGYRNRFGHPKPLVVDRYSQAGSQLYRSDQDGALLLDFSSSDGVALRRWRGQEHRYWQDATRLAENSPAR
ncbi:MAG TPA: DNA internalization-related competence protein ComEC/Rec2 [Methylophilaceae bacterium]